MLWVYIMYIHMQTRIRKWGNSLGLRIPRAFASEAQVEDGSIVDVSVENGCLQIRPIRSRRFLLRELLKGVNRQNLHTEISSGGPVGREAW
jgi:antitoxin MazE